MRFTEFKHTRHSRPKERVNVSVETNSLKRQGGVIIQLTLTDHDTVMAYRGDGTELPEYAMIEMTTAESEAMMRSLILGFVFRAIRATEPGYQKISERAQVIADRLFSDISALGVVHEQLGGSAQ